jgi:hypothetical protein
LVQPEHVPQEFEAYLQAHCDLRDQQVHQQLQADLAEHFYEFGANQ